MTKCLQGLALEAQYFAVRRPCGLGITQIVESTRGAASEDESSQAFGPGCDPLKCFEAA